MKISIRTKNIDLTQDLRDYVDEKIGRDIGRFLTNEKTPLEADVELTRVTHHHQKGLVYRAEVQILLHGHKLIAEAGGENIKEAIDIVKDELEGEIKKHRGKEKDVSIKRSRFLKAVLHLSPAAWFKKKKQ